MVATADGRYVPPYDPSSDWSEGLEAKLHRLDARDPVYPYDRWNSEVDI
jgi:hypothetical protein